MSDEEGPKYKNRDIVWVKLGSCWWPGEVTEDAPEDFTSKKPPLVIVKFFNEDTYEFVKTFNNIYHYNCERKNEFIKKGMDSFRANNTHMEKFPSDVSLAEMRTEGNPNILSDPQFAPQKKTNVIAEVFGTPSPKKTPKDGNKHRSRPSTSKNSSKKPVKINITHRRFLGLDDYEAHVRVQYPGKDNEHLSSDEDEIVRLNAEPSQTFNCSECTFSTNRIEVMLFHVQCHIKGIETSPIKKKIVSPKKKKTRVPPPKHITSEDDRTNSSTGFVDTDSEEDKPKPKRKKKTPTSSPKKTTKVKKVEPEEKTVVLTDIRTNLLAEWSDSEENEEEEGEGTSSKHDTSGESNEKKTEETEVKDEEPEEKKMDEQTSKDLKSCFDFDEEEEEEDIVQKTEHGRKIPRVIPPTDKRKSTDDSSLGDEENRSESLSENSNSVELAKQEEVFKVLMESTMVPDLPEVPPDSSKPQENFTDSKTVKIPDKEVATKLTNPKKRFVKSFEDFENFQNEQRKAQEKAVVVERMVDEVAEEPPKVVEETPSVVEETPPVVEETPPVVEETPPIIEETPPVVEEKIEQKEAEEPTDIFEKIDTNLQISKLKSQLMSKMSDDEPEAPKPVKKTTSHRTPRSKILESYRNDKNKEETHKNTDDEESFSPKKSKYEEEDEKIEEETNKSDVIKEIEAIPEKNPDEEIEKINQIDDYLNDFLFNIPKKDEEEEEEKKAEEKEETPPPPPNEVQIPCASENGDSDTSISIKTNLSNFDKEEGEMSALNTLAMVSQLEKPEPPSKTEPELVPIDGNLTVVSEKDLADAQVEITATCKKPVTLTNFSMDFSECNSNSTSDSLGELNETKKDEEEPIKKVLGPDDIFDIEDHIPSQIVDKNKPPSKLLERLTTTEPKIKDNSVQKIAKVPMTKDSTKVTKTKFVIKAPTGGNKIIKGATKPINILSEKIIKPVKPTDASSSVSVQKITSKRNLQDADEIDAFIIQKGAKNVDEEETKEESEDDTPVKKIKKSTDPKKLQVSSNSVKKRGKAKILQQTIITPAGEIIQPTTTATTTTATPTTVSDDNVFDINSMPIVLSDQILTPESIENMPIYLSDSVQSTPEPLTPTSKVPTLVKKSPLTVQQNQTPPVRVLNKSLASASKLIKTPKIIGSVGSKFIKQNSFASGSSKHGKYVIVTQSPPTTAISKYTVGKKQTFVKRVAGDLGISTAGTLTKVQNVTAEPTGNKIMILTDDKGQQQRVLLTPAQQKMMGYQTPGTKVTKTVVKGNIIQKSKDGQMTAVAGSSGLVSKSLSSSRINSNQTLISSSGHVLGQIHPQQTKTMRIEKQIPSTGRKIQMQSQKVPIKTPQQKTILIKNQHGQTVRKIQGTDDALLDKQVAEQLEAIKASGVLQQKHQTAAKNIRRSYAKKIESPKPQMIQKTKNENVVPPLAPISPKKPDQDKQLVTTQTDTKQDRALHQLVIQDAMGNQTTITEGQILALPSETIDGQPQSYMLVTLDESGNLTPLNNEALLSLDPNLGLGGDLGNTVLQIDQNAIKEEPASVVTTTAPAITAAATTTTTTTTTTPPPEVAKTESVVTEAVKEEEKPPEVSETPQEQIVDSSVMHTMGESGQQLIVTGDPIAAQKFLESLTEGNTDLANILASAEGSSILIHTDGQQILINTDSDNQMLLSVNTDNLNMAESTEGGGNPIFATQPAKNQDILAAALADTDVFQQEQNGGQSKVAQLSPNSALYPMNVGNVLETSLTLNSPIMTPLEVPSTNSKKITDENDILNQVPKNVDLPITITDPNISQTVAQQQVASLMVNELQGNLELSLPISEGAITVTSSEMNSPSFVYSLPSLDGTDITQKPFNSSMPLLTEDTEEVVKEDKIKTGEEDKPEPSKISPEGSFLDESEGLCTLGGEMCSSLSEPPPDMFDLSAVLSSHQIKSDSDSPKEEKGAGDELVIMEETELKIDDKSMSNTETETSSPNTMNEDSCEIPVQPNIVTTLKEDGFGVEEMTNNKREGEELENENKKCKFD